MAQKKITDLQLIDEVTDSLSIPSDNSIQSYRFTASQMKSYILPDGAITAAKTNKTMVSGQTEDSAPLQADSVLTYDASADALKRATVANMLRLMKAQNYADNPEFRFFQRQDPATLTTRSDAGYGPDRWKLLTSHTTNVQSARVAASDTVDPTRYGCQIRQADSTARQIGILQILDTDKCLPLRGKTVTFAFKAKTDGTEITTIRAGILEWTSTANAPTADPVSSWSATPTLVSNWAFKNTPADITISSTLSGWLSVTVTLGSTFNNLGLMIWTPNTEAQNDDLYIEKVQLVDYDEPLPFAQIRTSFPDDARRCMMFYEKSYDLDTVPGTATQNGCAAHGPVTTGVWIYGSVQMKVPKLLSVTPTYDYWDANGNNQRFSYYTQGGNAATHNASYTYSVYLNSMGFAIAIASGGANGNVNWHWRVEQEL